MGSVSSSILSLALTDECGRGLAQVRSTRTLTNQEHQASVPTRGRLSPTGTEANGGGRRHVQELFGIKGVANFDDYRRKSARCFKSRLPGVPENLLGHVQLCVSFWM